MFQGIRRAKSCLGGAIWEFWSERYLFKLRNLVHRSTLIKTSLLPERGITLYHPFAFWKWTKCSLLARLRGNGLYERSLQRREWEWRGQAKGPAWRCQASKGSMAWIRFTGCFSSSLLEGDQPIVTEQMRLCPDFHVSCSWIWVLRICWAFPIGIRHAPIIFIMS